jgi:hypothetical protein
MNSLKFYVKEKIKAIAWLDSLIDSLKDGKQYEVTVKEIKPKRSLSANAYAWVLLNKLSDKLNKDVITLYRELIKDVGGNVEVVRLEDRCINMMCELWRSKGLGWVTDCEYSGYEGWTDVFLYYGSSSFDKRQMAKFIDLIVQECKQNDIETEDPAKIQRLCEEWGV